jgi:CheY-like chemotaxis protein
MNPKTWTVCVVEPNKFEAQIIIDLLRMGGVDRIKVFHDPQEAAGALELYPADVIIASFEMSPVDGALWTRAFRRNHGLANRKAAVFLTSRAFSRQIAEQCRHAGANALIGKPLSGKSLMATIHKVLAKPRPFIDNAGEGYVGPCRRAGIVTTASTKRRRSDSESQIESVEKAAANA